MITILVNSIQVWIAIWTGLVHARLRSFKRSAHIAESYLINMLMCAPSEENFIGFKINLINETILNPAIFRTPNRAKIGLRYIDSSHQNCAIVGELTLVNINARVKFHRIVEDCHKILRSAIERDSMDFVVRTVQDTDMSKSKTLSIIPCPVCNHRFTVEHLWLQSRIISLGPLPYQLTIIGIDCWISFIPK